MANDRWPGPGDDAWRDREETVDAPGADADTLDALRSERDAKGREAAEAQERYLRTLADFENFRRRTGREREEWRRQAQEDVLREILPVLDNFDRWGENPVDQWGNWAPQGINGGVPLELRAGQLASGNSGFAYRSQQLTGDMEAYFGAPESYDAIEIDGLPPLSMKIAGGIHGDIATASMIVN